MAPSAMKDFSSQVPGSSLGRPQKARAAVHPSGVCYIQSRSDLHTAVSREASESASRYNASPSGLSGFLSSVSRAICTSFCPAISNASTQACRQPAGMLVLTACYRHANVDMSVTYLSQSIGATLSPHTSHIQELGRGGNDNLMNSSWDLKFCLVRRRTP